MPRHNTQLQDRRELCSELERDTTICKFKTKPFHANILGSKAKQASVPQSTPIKIAAAERGTVGLGMKASHPDRPFVTSAALFVQVPFKGVHREKSSFKASLKCVQTGKEQL